MPLATRPQYAMMLDAATDGGYAFAAINVTSSETFNAALRGFEPAEADGIVQVTVSGAEFLSGAEVADGLLGARALAGYARVVAEASPVRVALHTDHCPPARVDDRLRPLLAESRRAVANGEAPLFHSHMFDGSTLPLIENLKIAAGLLAEGAELGLVLEVECGGVGGEEDGIYQVPGAPTAIFTPRPPTCCRWPTRSGQVSGVAIWSPQRSATSTAPRRPATSCCAPRSSEQVSRHSPLLAPAHASSTSFMGAVAPPSEISPTRFRSESSRSTWTRTVSTRSPARWRATCSTTGRAC